jgi:tRNA(Ile)-lysidine synthase
MVGPQRPVAEIRVAVRRALADLPPHALVLVACSGGADSLALAAATAFEAPRAGLRAGLVTVDHRLQEGSGDQARRVAAWADAAGFSPVEVLPVTVGRTGGPEAAARSARYAALDAAVARHAAAAVLLGHTRDDQAETVLLALARGSGPRALAGMPERRGVYRRPLLDVPRATTRAACAAESMVTWEDPHNSDPAYARARVRALLPTLEEAVGRGAVAGLARSARLVRADAELLDALATELSRDVTEGDGSLDAEALRRHPVALRTRVLHAWAVGLGAPPGALAASHVDALDALVVAWSGQGPVCLPGGIDVARTNGRLRRHAS